MDSKLRRAATLLGAVAALVAAGPVRAQAPAERAQPQAQAQAQALARAEAQAQTEKARAQAEAAQAETEKARAQSEKQQADLERQLAAARERLEQAAREVASLSQQMVGEDVLRFRSGGGPRRAMLGVQLGEPASGGVRIAGVSPGGPAAAAGLKPGDVIVAIDGHKTPDARQIAERMRSVEPGKQARVDVDRDGKTRTFVVVTREMEPRVAMLRDADDLGFAIPDLEAPLRMAFERFRPWGELELATLTKDLGRYFGAERGVLVVRAPADGRLPLRDGDVITAIDGREPQSGSHALRILRSYQPGEKLSLSILRDRRAQKLEVTLPPADGMPPLHGRPRAPAAPPGTPASPVPGPA